jgi:hypothetical protein
MGGAITKLSAVAIVGLSLGWAEVASAQFCCGWDTEYVCNTVGYYHQARYTNGGAGDVALVPTSSSPTGSQVALAPIAAALGFKYVHAQLLYDGTGSTFTQTYWDGNSPPSSKTTGEPHICSRVISPFFLARLWPGAGTAAQDAVPADLVKGFGRAGCTVPADSYHFNSFIHDEVPGGSCEKLLVDYCGVPVNATLDRKVYGPNDSFNAVSTVWKQAYNKCMTVINGVWPWSGIGCGGDTIYDACARASYQVVNAMLYNAYPLESGCRPGTCYEDGWSDYNGDSSVWSPNGPYPPPEYNQWFGTMLGASKTNYETNPDGTPCQTIASGGPIGCAGDELPSWTINDPDDILAAASRLGASIVGGSVAPGYVTYQQVCDYEQVCTLYCYG